MSNAFIGGLIENASLSHRLEYTAPRSTALDRTLAPHRRWHSCAKMTLASFVAAYEPAVHEVKKSGTEDGRVAMCDGGDVDDGRDAGVVRSGEEWCFEEAGERGGSEEVDLGDASDALGRVRLGDEVGAGVVDEDVEARGARGHGRGERADAGV